VRTFIDDRTLAFDAALTEQGLGSNSISLNLRRNIKLDVKRIDLIQNWDAVRWKPAHKQSEGWIQRCARRNEENVKEARLKTRSVPLVYAVL
jgi:hypothetical protein